MNDNILFFDIESTGLSVYRDKIVELGLLYNGKEKVLRFNPEMNISEGASRVHGIRNSDVDHLPLFSDKAEWIYKLFSSADSYGGYNIRTFDLPMLQVELLKVNSSYVLPHKPVYDVYEHTQSLFRSLKLKDIYLTLSGKKLDNAHSAIADIKATKDLYYIIKNKFS